MNVRVGRGVSVGVSVGVLVGKMIEVTVANWVGERNTLGVHGGAVVGLGEVLRFNPPHAMSSKVSTVVPISVLRKRL